MELVEHIGVQSNLTVHLDTIARTMNTIISSYSLRANWATLRKTLLLNIIKMVCVILSILYEIDSLNESVYSLEDSLTSEINLNVFLRKIIPILGINDGS